MADLTTRDKVKRVLGVPSSVTQHDTLIDTLLEVADQQILAYCGMAALTQTTVTNESYDIESNHENELVLRNFPVISVASMLVAGATVAATSYYVDERAGVIRLSNYGSFFTEGRERVEVTYTFGHATVPEDLSHAATLICAAQFNAGRHAGLANESVSGYRYSVDGRAMPVTAEAILARYRRAFPSGSI